MAGTAESSYVSNLVHMNQGERIEGDLYRTIKGMYIH